MHPSRTPRSPGAGAASDRRSLLAHDTPTVAAVRHATPAGLERISDLLERLRGVNGLVSEAPVFDDRLVLTELLDFHERVRLPGVSRVPDMERVEPLTPVTFPDAMDREARPGNPPGNRRATRRE